MSKLHKSEALWQDRVSLEVGKIRSQKQFRRKDDIAKAWVNNRKEIEKTRHEMNTTCPPVPYIQIPKVVANTDPPEDPPQEKEVCKDLE